MDDSGTRHPDHAPNAAKHNHDWFALGGVLIDDEDIPKAKELIGVFRSRWPMMGQAPLHSWAIRGSNEEFKWLGAKDSPVKSTFMADLESLLLSLPVVGLSCVIDRPGYNARYKQKHRERWALCKTAFAVAVERATKYAMQRERKLRVYVEKTNKIEDRVMKGYYEALREGGHWFDQERAGKYAPVSPEEYRATLYEFATKAKTSNLTQIADLYLWPMCMGGYEKLNRPYSSLMAAGKLIDCSLAPEEVGTRGIKYSCFDGGNS